MPAEVINIMQCKGFCFEKPFMVVRFHPIISGKSKKAICGVSFNLSQIRPNEYNNIAKLSEDIRESEIENLYYSAKNEFELDNYTEKWGVSELFNSYLIPLPEVSKYYSLLDSRKGISIPGIYVVTQEDYNGAKRIAQKKIKEGLENGRFCYDQKNDDIIWYNVKLSNFRASENLIPLINFNDENGIAEDFISAVLYDDYDEILRIESKQEKISRRFLVSVAIKFKNTIDADNIDIHELKDVYMDIVKAAFILNWQKVYIVPILKNEERYFQWFKKVIFTDVETCIDDYYTAINSCQSQNYYNWTDDSDIALEGYSRLELGLD